MAWPTATDYNEAIQNLGVSAGDEELRAGQLQTTSLGLPMIWSGNFADVYKIYCPATDNTWALKCFTREVSGLRERYREIAAHLDRARLPFTVDFQYLEQGIRVGGQWFPALKMQWVEGLTLNRFVEEYVNRPKTLSQLLSLWVRMADRLRAAEVAHADLQHGNVLLVPMSRGRLALRLIDYDGMHVPALAGTRSGELGHPAFQHPQRFEERIYSAEVDRFSHLAIFCAVRCLTVGRRELWQQFNNEDNLLFRESDFRNPGKSEVFRTLWELPDANCRALTGHLALACRNPLEEVPLLTELIDNGNVLPLSRQEETAVKDMLAHEEKARSIEEDFDRLLEEDHDRLLEEDYDRLVEEDYDRLAEEAFDRLVQATPVTDAADTDKGSAWWVSESASFPSERTTRAQPPAPSRESKTQAFDDPAGQLTAELESCIGFSNILGRISILAFLSVFMGFLVPEVGLFAVPLFIGFSIWWCLSLFFSPLTHAISVRKQFVRAKRRELNGQEEDLESAATEYTYQFRKMCEDYDSSGLLKNIDRAYHNHMKQLYDEITEKQMQRFLAAHSIRGGLIWNIGPQRVRILTDYRVTTAYDVNRETVKAIPGFGEALVSCLLAWRETIEQSFRFAPDDPEFVVGAHSLQDEMQKHERDVIGTLQTTYPELKAFKESIDESYRVLTEQIKATTLELKQANQDLATFVRAAGLGARILNRLL